MIGQFKLLLAGGLLAMIPVLLAFTTAAPQDPVPTEDTTSLQGVRQETRWNFAVLQYTGADGKTVEIPARNLAKLWLLTREQGDLILEILYENRDYSIVSVRDLHILRRSATLSSIDVPIVRGSLSDMAFPNFK